MNSFENIAIIIAVLFLEIITHLGIGDLLDQLFYTPLSIYNQSSMNWFGTICVYILIFPFSFILGIGGFLRWLFTVGRKD